MTFSNISPLTLGSGTEKNSSVPKSAMQYNDHTLVGGPTNSTYHDAKLTVQNILQCHLKNIHVKYLTTQSHSLCTN